MIQILIFGFLCSFLIGPIGLFILKQSMLGRREIAFKVLGILVITELFAISLIGVCAAPFVPIIEENHLIFKFLEGLFLTLFALFALHGSSKQSELKDISYKKVAIISLLNPGMYSLYLFSWIHMVSSGQSSPFMGLIVFVLGGIIGNSALIEVLSRAQNYLKDINQKIERIVAMAMGVFGLYTMGQLII